MPKLIELPGGNTLTTDVGGYDILRLNDDLSRLFENQCRVVVPLNDEAHHFVVKDVSVLIQGRYSIDERDHTFQSYAVVSGKSLDSFTVRLSGR